jgi:hypothetical protein
MFSFAIAAKTEHFPSGLEKSQKFLFQIEISLVCTQSHGAGCEELVLHLFLANNQKKCIQSTDASKTNKAEKNLSELSI